MKKKKTCSIVGCENPQRSKGYCQTHYMRLYRHGDALGGREQGMGLVWLRNAVEKNISAGECLLGWPHCVNGEYPIAFYEGKAQHASRIVLILSGMNPTPERNHCLHSCDNPLCLNPAHLRWGTHQENMADKMERNRQARGGATRHAKLIEAEVIAIRERYAGGLTQKQISVEFSISRNLVSYIVNRKAWAHVSAE